VPANRRSLAITNAYGQRLKAIERRVLEQSRRSWQNTGEFDADYARWFEVMAPAVAAAQAANVTLTSAYLGAFESSERGRVVRPPQIDPAEFVGKTRDGRSFEEGWTSPPIKSKVAMAEGKTIEEAAKIGFEASSNLVRLDTYAAARDAMSKVIRDSGGIIGYRRVSQGETTCGGCLAAESGDVLSDTEDFATHAGCDCVAEPVYGDVDDLFNHPTGAERYSRLSAQEKIEAVGLDAAQLIDDGQIRLAELQGVSVTALGDNFLTERPLKDVI
jgi:hypothetical protein